MYANSKGLAHVNVAKRLIESGVQVHVGDTIRYIICDVFYYQFKFILIG